jgi:superfamily II DNA or RNA helicase
MNLRPYQTQLITDIRLQYQLGKRAVLAVLPTGGGKTVCFSYIAQAAARKGNRVCILVHRQELLDQASRSLSGMDVQHGIIAAKRGMDLSHAVQVASVGTLSRRLHLLPRDFFQLAVIDECHHSSASTWAKIIQHFQTAKLLGVTATPIRGDGRGLGEHYQSMVQGPSAAWLTDNGYLAPAKVLAPPGFSSAGLRKRMGDFDMSQATELLQGQAMGDCLTHYRQHLSGQTAIAFCCSVAHAEAVARLFQDAGIAASSIDGNTDSAKRRQLLIDLGTGSLKVLTSCALIGEGVDVPSVGGCILLRPTASVGLHLQMIGRCLRPQPGKRAVVLDHVGNSLRLGHHLEEREWSLDGATKRDREASPSVKVCPQCFSTCATLAAVCGECGHEFRTEVRELTVVEGELKELAFRTGPYKNEDIKKGDIVRCFANRCNYKVMDIRKNGAISVMQDHPRATKCYDVYVNQITDIINSQSEQKHEQGTAQSLDDLRQLAQQRGYKRGWAERVYQARLAKR